MSTKDHLSGKTIEAARRILTDRFKTAGIESPELDARLLLGAALGLDHTALVKRAADNITEEQSVSIGDFARRRIAREPVARILGRKEFWGLDFQLSDATLVPRPDTETLIEAVRDMLRGRFKSAEHIRIADIGTGSGAILLALLSEFPNAVGIGTDINAQALATAQLNARRLDLANRATFVRCDYAKALSPSFDVIVSNPPYIASADIANLEIDVRDHDPHVALDGGIDGLDAYRTIAPQAFALLSPGGALIVEIGQNQAASVSRIMHAAGFAVEDAPRRDLGGIDRVITGLKPSF